MAHAEQEVVIGDRGRLVLPAAVRSALGLKTGTRLLVSAEADGSLRLRPFRSVADQNRGALRGLAPEGSLAGDLLSQRRTEAADEAQ